MLFQLRAGMFKSLAHWTRDFGFNKEDYTKPNTTKLKITVLCGTFLP